MANKHVHVVSRDDGWAVTRDNQKRASKVTSTKEQAVQYAKNIAKREKTELSIHNQDGKISQKHSYGNDPYPPKG